MPPTTARPAIPNRIFFHMSGVSLLRTRLWTRMLRARLRRPLADCQKDTEGVWAVTTSARSGTAPRRNEQPFDAGRDLGCGRLVAERAHPRRERLAHARGSRGQLERVSAAIGSDREFDEQAAGHIAARRQHQRLRRDELQRWRRGLWSRRRRLATRENRKRRNPGKTFGHH